MGAPAQKSAVGDTGAKINSWEDTNTNIFWKLYAGKFFGNYMLENFFKLYAGKVFWQLHAGKFF